MKKYALICLCLLLSGCGGDWDTPQTPPEKMTCKQLQRQALYYQNLGPKSVTSFGIGQESELSTLKMLMKEKGC